MTSSGADDWLAIDDLPAGAMTPEQVNEIVRAAVMDDASRADPGAVAPAGMPPLERALVTSMRQLRPDQRAYLRAYVAHGCNRSMATRVLRQRGLTVPDRSTVSRWFLRPQFKQALDAMKKIYLDMAGLDPEGVILKAGQVYEQAMREDRVKFNRDGETVGFDAPDLGNAMRSLEFMGRVNRMTTGDDGGTRVTLKIVNIADREPRDVVAEQ